MNRGQRPPLLLLIGFAVFVVVIVVLVASSVTHRGMEAFEPTSMAGTPRIGEDTVDTLTIDARDPDQWQRIDLDTGRLLRADEQHGWDIAVRRFHLVPALAAANVGRGDFDQVARAPDSGYIPTSLGSDTTNAVTRRWYSYGMLSHLLEPKGYRYVIQTDAGRHVKLQVLSYYCPGLEAGCFTFRYAWLSE